MYKGVKGAEKDQLLKTEKWGKCPKYSGFSKWLSPVYYCVQQMIVSSKILCPHLLLVYTCPTIPCLQATVVSCCASAWHSRLL